MTSADGTIAELAAHQHGVFTADQARQVGLSIDQMRHRVATGRWRRPTRGVFVLVGVPDGPEQRAAIAHLRRPRSVLSHLTAARLAGLEVPEPPLPVLTVAPGASGRSALAQVHRLSLPDDLVVRRGVLRQTGVPRTLVDCATVLGPKRLRRLVDEAFHARLVTVAALNAALRASPHVRGRDAASLLDAVEVWHPAIRPESPAEARLLRTLDAWGLPTPQRQVVVRDAAGVALARLDAAWPDIRLGLEYDSARWHGPLAWEHDERRHGLISRLGWRLEHVDKADLLPGRTDLRDRLLTAHLACTKREQVPVRARAIG